MHDSAELAHTLRVAVVGYEGLGETTAELTTVSSGLSGGPIWDILVDFLPFLAYVGEHLLDRVGTTVAFEVFKPNC